MVNNLLADMITRINNSTQLKLFSIKVLNSKFCINILIVLYNLGFISGFKILNFKYINVFLRYYLGKSVIRRLCLLSKPTNRVYISSYYLRKNLYKQNYNSIFILSTTEGLLIDKFSIIFNKGGELILEIF